MTLLITAACLGAGAAIDGGSLLGRRQLRRERRASRPAVAVLAWLANINAVILVFNLLPAFPLDGGRIVRAIAWKVTGNRDRATIFAARLGQGFAYAFIGLGILLALTGSLFFGVWLALIGWMLGGSARATANRSKLNTKLDGLPGRRRDGRRAGRDPGRRRPSIGRSTSTSSVIAGPGSRSSTPASASSAC